MFKIKWCELGARLSRIFLSQKQMEKFVALLRQSGIRASPVIAPAAVPRRKPKSKPSVPGGRGTAIVGADGVEIKVGERCQYRTLMDFNWRRGTLERVKINRSGTLAWVHGKYMPWRMVDQNGIRAFPKTVPAVKGE